MICFMRRPEAKHPAGPRVVPVRPHLPKAGQVQLLVSHTSVIRCPSLSLDMIHGVETSVDCLPLSLVTSYSLACPDYPRCLQRGSRWDTNTKYARRPGSPRNPSITKVKASAAQKRIQQSDNVDVQCTSMHWLEMFKRSHIRRQETR